MARESLRMQDKASSRAKLLEVGAAKAGFLYASAVGRRPDEMA